MGYQWKKNGSPIDGATASSYTTPVTTSADHGARFSVVLSNSAGTVTSSEASLTVGASHYHAASSPDGCPRQNGHFLGHRNRNCALGLPVEKRRHAYQPVPHPPATPIANASSADDGVYSVVVTDSAGTVTSSNASLTVSRYSLLANASGGLYDKTECVLDNDTGLVWEGKNCQR